MPIYQSPPDGGILYAETNLEHFFPEPLNMITSFLFLGVALYWTFKLWGKGKEHTFLSVALVLLYVGGIGGTIYHGLRRWNIFIMMDWLPIMLLCVAAGVYFIWRLTRWYYAVVLVLFYACFMFIGRTYIANATNVHLFININYAVLAAIVLVPVVAYLIKTRFKNGMWVGFALLAFIFALTFRVSDMWGWLQWGTHFLWHTFGAVAAFCMFEYLYLINKTKTVV
ncbi:hypothetical protein [Flavobacterium rhizosphaerae]|uniref:Hemolysin III n=1 Tax=Flavobacterium rhizosphaerae TaxID=3163298 RepID=A0ABW8YTQ1_9FLAO